MITLATWFTIARIVVTPLIILAMMYNHWIIAGSLFAGAIVTDWLDGWIARVFRQETSLGALLDTIADKFLIMSCIATFFYKQCIYSLSLNIFLVLLLLKECLTIIGVALLYYFQKLHIKPAVLGKYAMALQMVGLLAFFFSRSQMPDYVLSFFFIIVIAISYTTLILYAYRTMLLLKQ